MLVLIERLVYQKMLMLQYRGLWESDLSLLREKGETLSRSGDAERWERLVNRCTLSNEEQETIHRHLGKHYQGEKDDLTYAQLEEIASEVVPRISPGS